MDADTLDAARARSEDPRGAASLGGADGAPFEDTLAGLDASPAVQGPVARGGVPPLTSGDVESIVGWLKSVVDYSPNRLEQRFGYRVRGKRVSSSFEADALDAAIHALTRTSTSCPPGSRRSVASCGR